MSDFEKYKIMRRFPGGSLDLILLRVTPVSPIQSPTSVSLIRVSRGLGPGEVSGQGEESSQNVASIRLDSATFDSAFKLLKKNRVVTYFSDPAVGAGLELINSFAF